MFACIWFTIKRVMDKRIEEEWRTVELMIRLYCRHKEGNRELCEGCREVLEYANGRLSKCRYGNGKPTCKQCPTHCYRPDMRQRIRVIMKYAGPRMIIYHPVAAIKHLLREAFRKHIKS